MGIDSPWPSVVFISLTLEGARHYVDEAVKQDLEPNPYRGIPHEYKSESIDNAEYEWNWNISGQKSKLLYSVENQHHEGYTILAVKVK